MDLHTYRQNVVVPPHAPLPSLPQLQPEHSHFSTNLSSIQNPKVLNSD